MHEPGLVRSVERPGDPHPHVDGRRDSEPTGLLEGVGEARALDVFHRYVDRALVLTPVVDGDDVGVVHGGRRVRGLTELLHDLRVAGQIGPEHLDRHRATELEILGEVHTGGGRRCELAPQLVPATEGRLGGLSHGCDGSPGAGRSRRPGSDAASCENRAGRSRRSRRGPRWWAPTPRPQRSPSLVPAGSRRR